jgi:hypothetical protein
MLSSDAEPTPFIERRSASRRAGDVTLHADVERLIGIAGQLFSTIERQIRSVEEGLAAAENQGDTFTSQTVLKEHLISTALRLNESLHDIAVRLEDRSDRSAILERSRR